MKKSNKTTIIIAGITLLTGLLAGWLIFGGSQQQDPREHNHEETTQKGETTYTCSMHPQIRQQEPGDCPICGMDLIPVDEEQGDQVDAERCRMSEAADAQLAGVRHAWRKPVKRCR
ncbi:MAG: heavy metal-binding domain-containing protein [Bacteroidales bacterium]|nr:heavy metal-binding domain-containing protein [Bacteroidales bacterium]